MNHQVFLSLATLVVSFAASAAQAGDNFDSGSEVRVQVTHHRKNHKHKVWVPAHRSHGHLVKGHYI
jgi:hypothetical protein